MEQKSRVLLIPDRVQWALGTIARQIAKWNPEVDFTILSDAWIGRYIDNPGYLFQSFDIVHFLSHSVYPKYRDLLSVPNISAIHHVVNWEAVKDNIFADMVVVWSTEWMKYLLSKGVAESKVFLMHYGVDTDVFRPLSFEKRHKLRQRIGLGEESIVVGFFAKATYDLGIDYKGIDILFEALRILQNRSNKEIVLLLSGVGWEQYMEKFSEYGIACFHSGFTPNHSDMNQKYGILDYYLITSRVEGGPFPLLEAMSCGIPVVTTPVGMAIDVIKDSQNGLLIPKEDPEAAAAALTELIKDSEFAHYIGKNARDTMVRSFRWQNSLTNIPELYKRALAIHPISENKTSLSTSKSGWRANYNVKDELVDSAEYSITLNSYLRRRRHDVEEEQLWIEYLSTLDRRSSRKAFLMLCLRNPWRLEFWRRFIVDSENVKIISFFVRMRSLLRKLKIMQ